jgi:hypothetical protein
VQEKSARRCETSRDTLGSENRQAGSQSNNAHVGSGGGG